MFYFSNIQERDIDFIIIRNFAQNPNFRKLFVKNTDINIVSISHSLSDIEFGESDISIIIEFCNQKHCILIENKIDAQAMPNQYERYIKRAEKGKRNGEYISFEVFLVAPQNYLETNSEAHFYRNKISYEQILELFQNDKNLFDYTILKKAIEKSKNKNQMVVSSTVTLFWKQFYNYCVQKKPTIEMFPPINPKGYHSTWIYFKVPIKNVSLIYKSVHGYEELEFSGKVNSEKHLKSILKPYIENNMYWQTTGKSISIRIKSLPIDFSSDFQSYINKIDIVLRDIETLSDLAKQISNQDIL